MPSSNSPNKRLFVGSLPYKFSEGELLTLFVPFGKVVAVKIIQNQWGKSRGMGYVEYDSLESAIAAKQELHGFKIANRSIIVDYSKPDPYLTEEGKQRHLEALSKKSKHHRPNPNITSRLTDSPPNHIRQSVYDSRYHGSKVGAKFAARHKKKA